MEKFSEAIKHDIEFICFFKKTRRQILGQTLNQDMYVLRAVMITGQ